MSPGSPHDIVSTPTMYEIQNLSPIFFPLQKGHLVEGFTVLPTLPMKFTL